MRRNKTTASCFEQCNRLGEKTSVSRGKVVLQNSSWFLNQSLRTKWEAEYREQ